MNKDYLTPLKQCLLLTTLLFGLIACSHTSSESAPSLLKTRYGHAAVQDGKRIFILSGANYSGLLSDVEVYDPVSGKTEHWKEKLIPRQYFSAVWDGKESIYILGGISISAQGRLAPRLPVVQSRVEILNTRTGEVTYAPDLPAPTSNNTAVFSQGRILVFGGSRFALDRLVPVPTVAIYDVASQQWFKGKDMPEPKDSQAVVKDGWVYLAGGYNQRRGLNSFARYSPDLNEWQVLPEMPVKLSAHSMTVRQNQLLVFGDYDETDSTYGYDFTKAQWQKLDLGYKSSRHSAAVTFHDDVYVFGGNAGNNGPLLNVIQKFSF